MFLLRDKISGNGKSRVVVNTSELLDFLHSELLLFEYIDSIRGNAVGDRRVGNALMVASVRELPPFVGKSILAHALVHNLEVTQVLLV